MNVLSILQEHLVGNRNAILDYLAGAHDQHTITFVNAELRTHGWVYLKPPFGSSDWYHPGLLGAHTLLEACEWEIRRA